MNSFYRSVRLSHSLNLIFFGAYLFTACRSQDPAPLELRWKNGQPTALSVPVHLLKEWSSDEDRSLLQVRLANNATAMLGNLTSSNGAIVFQPLLPFSPGANYQVYFKDRFIATVRVPEQAVPPPRVLAIYPTADSLPENLLKCYVFFSTPMREGLAGRYLQVRDAGGQVMPDVLLDLEPELWNEDRTVLTVWLNPGRIKRGLIPNEKMGKPLYAGNDYTLGIDAAWPSAAGVMLGRPVNKHWKATTRDTTSPDPARWQLRIPQAGTSEPLQVAFGEPLDHYVMTESLVVLDQQGSRVAGRLDAGPHDQSAIFVPAQRWQAGTFTLVVDTVLEDLAGNNLVRLFDRDLAAAPAPPAMEQVSFVITPRKN